MTAAIQAYNQCRNFRISRRLPAAPKQATADPPSFNHQLSNHQPLLSGKRHGLSPNS